MRACIRKSLDSRICSSTSHRTFLSEEYPWALLSFTADSMSEIRMASLPTTATVLSMYLYFCAEAPVQNATAAKSVNTAFFIISNILQNSP